MRGVQTIVLALLCFGGLALARVAVQYDRGVDFSKFHTYKWVTIPGASMPDQITGNNVRNAINAELARKGLVLVKDSRPADLYVAYQISIDPQKELNWFNSGGPLMKDSSGGTATTIAARTVVLDFCDPVRKQILWRGSGTRTINSNRNPDENYERLQKAIAKLLRGFPPPSRHP